MGWIMTKQESQQVAAFLRRMAPVQTHAMRRAFLAAADELEVPVRPRVRPRARASLQLIDPENEITGHARTEAVTFTASSGHKRSRCLRLQNGEPVDCMTALAEWAGRPYSVDDPRPRPCVVCRREPEDRDDEGGAGMREVRCVHTGDRTGFTCVYGAAREKPCDRCPHHEPQSGTEAEIPDREAALAKATSVWSDQTL